MSINERAPVNENENDKAMKKNKLLLAGVAALAIIAAIALVMKLRGQPTAGAAEAGTRADVPYLDGQWIRFSPAFAERTKIEFAVVDTAELTPVLEVTGDVAFDPEHVAAIGARIPGRVRRMLKYAGDEVKTGDVLAEIESADLGQAQAAVLSARAHGEAANANYARETTLAEQHVTSQRDAELAKATASAAKAELFAAEQRVRALGGQGASEIGVLRLVTPIAGRVVEAKVSQGQTVEPSHTAFRVADLSRLWVQLAVFERDLSAMKVGDVVEIAPQTNPDKMLRGAVAHVGDIIDKDTRSADVRVVVENPERTLRAGESVQAKIHTSRARSRVVLVPRDAITTVDGKPTVFVEHDATSVEPRAIVVGATDTTRIEVKSGVKAGERIAIKGVFALKSEVFR